MKPAIDTTGSYHTDELSVITDVIRCVSAKAREVEITPNSLLFDDLALDSLDLVALILRLQDHFQVEIDPDLLPNTPRVGDLVASVTEQARAAA
jgi:acyl carrier protein